MVRRTALATLLALAGTATPALAAPSSPTALTGPRGTSTAKVLVIGIDGTRWDQLRRQMDAGNAPRLKALAARGVLTPQYIPSGHGLDQTLSGPSWNTILRGVWEDRHGVDSNSDCTYDHHQSSPDFLTRLERWKPSLSTFAAATWTNITTTDSCGPYVSDEVDAKYHPTGAEDDDVTAAEAARYLRANGPDAGFVHLDQVDEAGHASGGTSQAYLDAIAKADRDVGMLVDAIAARPAAERWTVLVTTDHGHLDAGGHGGSSAAERTSWLLAAELGTASGELPAQSAVLPGSVRPVDVAATAIAHEGLDPASVPALEGRRLPRTASTDPFDALSGALRPAVDETPDPYWNARGQLYGFTHTAPSGWSVVNGAGADRGVTEWRGWSFTTDPFWSAAQHDQGREELGAFRGVFAVADGDELNDTPALVEAPEVLDTTLVSPAWSVSGARTATVGYEERYRQDATQSAELSVSFDGGAATVVRRLGSASTDANAGADVRSHRVSLAVAVPSGARTMTVRWRYRGGNDWYWAIDDPRVALG